MRQDNGAPMSHGLERLRGALAEGDKDRAWEEWVYGLGPEERNLVSRPLLDSLWALQAQESADVEESCQRLLALRTAYKEIRDQASEGAHAEWQRGEATFSVAQETLDYEQLHRLFYLLLVRCERYAAFTNSSSNAPASTQVQTLRTILGDFRVGGHIMDAPLFARFVTRLARLDEPFLALRYLQELIERDDRSLSAVDRRTCEAVMDAFGRVHDEAVTIMGVDSKEANAAADSGLDALRLTLRVGVEPNKSAVHRLLRTLSITRLRALLPPPVSSMLRPWRLGQKQAHPWADSGIEPALLDALSQRVVLVLAQRGSFQEGIELIRAHAAEGSSPPDRDVYMAIISTLVRQAKIAAQEGKTTSSVVGAGGSASLQLALRTYFDMSRAGVQSDALCHEHLINGLSIMISRHQQDRKRRESPPKHTDGAKADGQTLWIAGQIEDSELTRSGWTQAAQQFTTSILASDPTMVATTSIGAHRTLLRIHLDLRDYSYAKRLYQLIQLRVRSSGSGTRTATGAEIRPAWLPCDRARFGWFFVHALKVAKQPSFAARLYVDFIASSQRVSPTFHGLLLSSLLQAGLVQVAQRILTELRAQRARIPPGFARTLVGAFADVGQPDAALSVAHELVRAFAPNPAPLEVYAIALNSASRARTGWTAERRDRILQLFEGFRSALNQAPHRKEGIAPPRTSRNEDVFKTAREAYNAAIRTHIGEHLMPQKTRYPHMISFPASDSDSHSYPHSEERDDEGAFLHTPLSLSLSRRHAVDELVQEMDDRGLEGDEDTWGLRILVQLMPDPDSSLALETPLPQKRLSRAMGLFDASLAASYPTGGKFELRNLADSSHSADTPEGESSGLDTAVKAIADTRDAPRKPVRLKSAIVGRLMMRLTAAGRYDDANRVFRSWRSHLPLHPSPSSASGSSADRRSGYDRGVEGARLYLLAAQGLVWKQRAELIQAAGYVMRPGFREVLVRASLKARRRATERRNADAVSAHSGVVEEQRYDEKAEDEAEEAVTAETEPERKPKEEKEGIETEGQQAQAQEEKEEEMDSDVQLHQDPELCRAAEALSTGQPYH